MNDIEMSLEELRAESRAWEKDFNELMSYQNAGMELEKRGLHEKAAEQYEQAVSFGRSSSRMRTGNYYHSICRLVIVYRKLRRYDDEIRVIRQALSEDMPDEEKKKLLSRLDKATTLKGKQ